MYRWGPWGLVALVLATRLPFMTQTLYAFDSGNFALAVRDGYNVAFHRPQPPGYPLYVGIASALNLLVREPNRALVLESVLLSAAAVAATGALAKALFGRLAGLLAGLLLVFTVGFWGYGEVAYAYVGLAAEMATLAYLAHLAISGRAWAVVPLGLAVGVAGGIRWDGAVFGAPLWLWALLSVPWRLRLASVAAAAGVVVAWAVPMVLLTGGPAAYLTAVSDYLRVWAPQSAYVVGAFDSGQAIQASYNLSFFVNYARQMLGVGLLLALYALVTRLGPARLAADYRGRFLALWIAPPVLTYLFTHLGEAGYVLSLAPAAALLAAVAILDLGRESAEVASLLRARRQRLPIPRPAWASAAVAVALTLAVVGWNGQAFLRGVGPGRLPDLRARDAITSAQVAFVRSLPPDSTLVLAHDTLRQAEYYLAGYRVRLLYSEYVPGWETQRTRTELPPGTRQVVVLDPPLQTLAEQPAEAPREVLLRESPRVAVWVLEAPGGGTVEHGYQRARLVPG